MAYRPCLLCGKTATGGHGCLMILLIIVTFPFGLLFLLIKPIYTCLTCGFRFKG
jgi:hypothetical protein